MENYILEFFGTLVLVLFGDGVCCACSLNKSKAQNAGWVVIALGWGLAVMMGALVAGPSGGHLNPAVSIGLAAAGAFPWESVPGYVVAQMLGGFVGAVVVYLFYIDHFKATEDKATKLGVFCTAPAIKNTPINFFGEFVATFMLMFAILVMANFGGQVGLVGITWVITAIGMSLGDLFDPLYVASAPKTMILKFIIGFIAGTVAHKVFKIARSDTKSKQLKIFISAGCGAFANILIEPCVSYLYYKFILDMSEKAAGAFAATKFLTFSVNAILATMIAPVLYLALSSRLKGHEAFKQLAVKD